MSQLGSLAAHFPLLFHLGSSEYSLYPNPRTGCPGLLLLLAPFLCVLRWGSVHRNPLQVSQIDSTRDTPGLWPITAQLQLAADVSLLGPAVIAEFSRLGLTELST